MSRSFTKIDRKNERMIYLKASTDSRAEKFPVYSEFIRNASPKFKTMVDEMDPTVTDLAITGISEKTLSLLIEFIKSTFEEGRATLPITDVNYHELAYAAEQFELRDVQALCKDYLECQKIRVENCIDLFAKASESTNENLKRQCLQFVLLSLDQVLESYQFVSLTLDQLQNIIHEGRAQGKCSEALLCNAATEWLKYRSVERRSYIAIIVEEFPSKEHKAQIFRAVRQVEHPKVQNAAFDVLLKSFTAEPEPMSMTSTAKIEQKVKVSESFPDLNDCESFYSENKNYTPASIKVRHPAARVSPLKRSSTSSLPNEEPASCSLSKKPKRSLSWANDENLTKVKYFASYSAATSNSTLPNNSDCCFEDRCPTHKRRCKAYFLNQHGTSIRLWSFNLHTLEMKHWSTNFPPGFEGLTGSSIQYSGGHLYIMGGKSDSGRGPASTNKVFIYNLDKNSWKVKEMLESRYGCRSVRLNSSLFVIGGRKKEVGQRETEFIHTVEKLDLKNDPEHWTQVEERSRLPCTDSGVAVLNNKIYTIGGFRNPQGNEMEIRKLTEMYDPETKQWRLLRGVLSKARHGLAAVSTEDAIYAIGGRYELGMRSSYVEILRAGSEYWEPGPELIKERALSSAIYCKEQNAIFVIGGDSEKNPTVEKLDLKTNIWSLLDQKLPSDHTGENYYNVAHMPCH